MTARADMHRATRGVVDDVAGRNERRFMDLAAFRSVTRLIGAALILGLVAACATSPSGDDGHGRLTSYALTLRHFNDREAITIMRAMREDFPGYRTHSLISKTAAVRRYEYRTTARAYKLEEWFYGLFRDMGFDPNRDTLVEVQGTRITVDKLAPKPPDEVPDDRPEPSPPVRPPPEESDPPRREQDGDEWQPITGG